MKMKKISTDRILGISAMVISVLTLLIFIYQTNIMRVQSKLSVKPRLDFTTSQDGDSTHYVFKEIIQNKGLGPAIVDSIYYRYRGVTHSLNTESLIESQVPKLMDYGTLIQHAVLGKGTTLLAGEEKTIFTYRMPRQNLDSVLSYLKIGIHDDAPFPIEVIYTSIYEDEQWLSNSLEDEPKKLD